MSIDLSTITLNQAIWLVLLVLGAILAFVIVRFFFQHILKFLAQGCIVILAIIGLLVLLHYFGVF